jgi:hypothetical protein
MGEDRNMETGQALNRAIRTLPFVERLGVAAELTGSLEFATRSGQEHLMNKVLAILRREVLDIEGPVVAADVACLFEAMSELEHEVGRVAPLPLTFNRHALVVIAALLRGRTTLSSVAPVIAP